MRLARALWYGASDGVAAQFAAILTSPPVTQVGRDHLDAVFLAERAVERVRVVGLVADESGGELVEEAFGHSQVRISRVVL